MTDRHTHAIELRRQGLTYRAIGDVLGVSERTAWEWVKRYRMCGAMRGGRPEQCERRIGHRGLHLAKGKRGLVYW